MKNQEIIWDEEYLKHQTKWKQNRPSIPAVLKNKNVLEVGVGNGKNLSTIIKKSPKSIVAMDISQEALNKCKKYSNLQLIKSDITKNNFNDKEFDVILCYYILNNLLEKDRKKAINQMERILSDKGIIIFEDFEEGDYRQNSNATKKLEKNTIIKKTGIIHHFFTKKEVKCLFSNFSSIKIKEKVFRQIKIQPSLKRKIIQAIIKK